jgi:hypothetical protein
MAESSEEPRSRARFNRGAWLMLLFAAVLLALSIAQLVYRYTLPTDGWEVYTEDVEPASWMYDGNLVGVASGLQSNDELLAVDGHSVSGTASLAYVAPPANWQVGKTVTYHVQRNGETLDVLVPVVHWTPAGLFTFNLGTLNQLLTNLGAMLFLFLGWFTFWKRPEIPSARAFLVLSTAVGATFISNFLPDGVSVQFNPLAFSLTAFFSYAIFGILLAPSLLAFSLLFPQPKQAIQRHPLFMVIPALFGLAVMIALFITDIPTLGWLGTLAMFIASLVSLVHAGLTQRDAVSRAQMRWVIGGFVLGLGLFMLNFPLSFNLISDPLLGNIAMAASSLGFVIIGVCLSIAVLRYRLFDIDVIIRKTLQYTVLTGLLALVYFGSVVLLQSLFESLTGQGSPIVIVISTLAIAALFNPLRQWVQRFIDRRFFRRKYDSEQILANFSKLTRDEVDMQVLTVAMLNVVEETIQPEKVSLWLKPAAHRSKMATGTSFQSNRNV